MEEVEETNTTKHIPEGFFVVIEGPEGTGKTTQVALVADALRKEGFQVTVTREPGATRIGTKIRAILLDPENTDLDPMAELLLYMADRSQHLTTTILPALSRGHIVISDRYYASSVAYQGAARGHELLVVNLLGDVAKTVEPDATIILLVDPEVGLKRSKRLALGCETKAAEQRFENEDISFHKKVFNCFASMSPMHNRRKTRKTELPLVYRKITTDDMTIQEVTDGILSALRPTLDEKAVYDHRHLDK